MYDDRGYVSVSHKGKRFVTILGFKVRFYSKGAVHYENTPIQIYWKSHTKKWKFLDKNSDIFHIYAQNKDCGYSLEPPRPTICVFEQIQKNIMYTTVNPSFTV